MAPTGQVIDGRRIAPVPVAREAAALDRSGGGYSGPVIDSTGGSLGRCAGSEPSDELGPERGNLNKRSVGKWPTWMSGEPDGGLDSWKREEDGVGRRVAQVSLP